MFSIIIDPKYCIQWRSADRRQQYTYPPTGEFQNVEQLGDLILTEGGAQGFTT